MKVCKFIAKATLVIGFFVGQAYLAHLLIEKYLYLYWAQPKAPTYFESVILNVSTATNDDIRSAISLMVLTASFFLLVIINVIVGTIQSMRTVALEEVPEATAE